MLHLPGYCAIYTNFLRLFRQFNYLGTRSRIHPTSDIRFGAMRHMYIGDRVSIAMDVWLNIPFEVKENSSSNPIIILHEGVAIGRRCTISGIKKIEIGAKSLFGPNVFITDHSHEFENPDISVMDQGVTEGGEIIIEDGCWFGHNSALVTHRGKAIRIGRNTIVGANAVVSKSFPPNSVLIGNPARNVGKIARAKI